MLLWYSLLGFILKSNFKLRLSLGRKKDLISACTRSHTGPTDSKDSSKKKQQLETNVETALLPDLLPCHPCHRLQE